jgi:hypothetical protein
MPTVARPIVDAANPKRGARLREANREQVTWGPIDPDALLQADDPARAIWAILRWRAECAWRA